jgi:hypothetical protein
MQQKVTAFCGWTVPVTLPWDGTQDTPVVDMTRRAARTVANGPRHAPSAPEPTLVVQLLSL